MVSIRAHKTEAVAMNFSNSLDIVIALAVLCWIIYRQLTWQVISPTNVWRMPLIIAVVGVVMLAQTKGLTDVSSMDVLILVGELVLAVVIGASMGFMARFRSRPQTAADIKRKDGIQVHDPNITVTESRTGGWGAALWIIMIALRIGVEVLANQYFPSALLASTGTILLVVAANRAARALVVTMRMERHLTGVTA
jgi:hypothetical protein